MITIARDIVREPLYAVVPVFNPWRHKSRVKHTERAIKHFHESGAVIVLVEASFSRRESVFADSGIDGMAASCGVLGSDHRFRHKYISLRTDGELWLKENLINIGVQHLPYDWEQVCWLDSDVQFVRPNWVGECIQKLQHFAFLQMFSQARDLAPNYELLPEEYAHASGESVVKAWMDRRIKTTLTPEIQEDLNAIGGDLAKLSMDFMKLEEDLIGNTYVPKGSTRTWPGLAWACTRKAWETVGGLIDIAIWGGSDFHTAYALLERPGQMMFPDLHRNYKKVVNQWYHRCRTGIRRNVGVMDGVILHNWHGKKVQRGYTTKHATLANLGFDPPRHLKRDSQGLWTLHDDGTETFVKLRETLRRVAKQRNEDSIDI